MFPFDPPENITKPKLSGTQDSAFEAVFSWAWNSFTDTKLVLWKFY